MDTLKGLGTALVTPFNKKLQVDYKALEKLVLFNLNKGVNYLVIQGTTGESATLSKQEKIDVFNFICSITPKKTPLVLGIGGNNTHQILKAYDWFDFSRVTAILTASPAYNKPTQDGIIRHYKLLAKQAPKPLLLYNVPSRTASNIQASTTLKLSRYKNIIGIKEASGDLLQVMEIIKHKPKNFVVLSGDDALTLPMMSFGVDGVISVVSNAFPAEFSKMIDLIGKQDYKKAAQIHLKLLEIINLLFKENNPAGIKMALTIQKLTKSFVRLPLLPASVALQKELKKAMKCF